MQVAIYARVSSDDQADRGTIENQLEFAAKYCDLHQLNVAQWYKDDGVTGTISLEERTDGAKLLQDAKAGLIDLLLIYRLDRLGRSARIILNSVYELEQYGVKVKSMTEPFDTGDPSGRFLLTILAGVADLERETILSRMWYGANKAAREGKWLGGIVPYGYFVNEEGFLEINETPLPGFDVSEADVIRLVYRLVGEQKMSCVRVADYLNALGLPPSYVKDGRKVKRGKRKKATAGIWRPSRVRNMIINKTYMGIHEYGKNSKKKDREIIVREVPAIVSKKLWEKSQQVLKSNQIEATRNAKRRYLLRSLIKCGRCGLTYIGTAYSGPGGKPKRYYVCNGKHAYRGPLEGKCTSKNIPSAWIEKMVWDNCVDFIEHPGAALRELSGSMEAKKSQRAVLETERQAVLKAAEGKDSEKETILDLYRKHLISAADVEKQLGKIAAEKEALRHRAQELQQQIDGETSMADRFTSGEEFLADLKEKLGDGNPPFKTKREIVLALVQEIIVNTEPDPPDGSRPKASVTVKYSFRLQPQVSQGITATPALVDSSGTVPVNARARPTPSLATVTASPVLC